MNMPIKLSFYGGAQEVTGANYLLECGPDARSGRPAIKLLVDCGLFQGAKTAEDENRRPFPYNPSEIDALFVTHAHLDHIGRIPKLVRDGFSGKIFSTGPTRDFAELSLIDSLGILTKEARRENKETFYSKEDVEKAMSLWEVLEYDEMFSLKDAEITLRDAGHILGSAMVEMKVEDKKILFTGDLGNPPVPLLKRPYEPKDIDYLIIESAYGDKEHEPEESRKIKIERAIEKAILNKGVLMVPAFSLERTQQLLYEINDLVENNHIPAVPIFLDSPLAIKMTDVYKKYESFYNKKAKFIISSGDDVFNFPGLKMTLTTEESKAINEVPPPKVVIAGAGMSTGGRIIHHEKRYLPDKNSILLIIGYQAAGSLGRQLVEGVREVKIFGEEVPVNAEVVSIRGYSAHADTNGLFDFVDEISEKLKKVFVVQGEARASLFFSQRVRDYLAKEAVVPKLGDTFELV
ncbi:MAG: MBL fold hydrolase [Candidatus Tagabacteria bacterium CG09_land_8_20_14_0_10_41_14]|uniref:MBL fold hydrolase n=1 Tax=Candidatus Tagabacteria bacterium CG09_land_8_20_14_0_10_41_14 TaxID=1975021 RepID=A0A2H0WM10_9BACT|nr:MAG: MBL fold hydrolase [Candidatus Tagabacteria bacterium CG09_land_8_20_14_0_10_41_14]